jgi:hypothetical protein
MMDKNKSIKQVKQQVVQLLTIVMFSSFKNNYVVKILISIELISKQILKSKQNFKNKKKS